MPSSDEIKEIEQKEKNINNNGDINNNNEEKKENNEDDEDYSQKNIFSL